MERDASHPTKTDPNLTAAHRAVHLSPRQLRLCRRQDSGLDLWILADAAELILPVVSALILQRRGLLHLFVALGDADRIGPDSRRRRFWLQLLFRSSRQGALRRRDAVQAALSSQRRRLKPIKAT